ncbi:hypothetical protein H9P43_004017 [Blastocladiella emersonii ATCC 22665]|nr:hypothetical protein H9P43_004017 [Blastocladiella emersonii ATCC 22665]
MPVVVLATLRPFLGATETARLRATCRAFAANFTMTPFAAEHFQWCLDQEEHQWATDPVTGGPLYDAQGDHISVLNQLLDSPLYSHLEQDGKESGDVEGVDGQDDAAPASKRSRTSDSSSRRLSDSEFLMGIKEVFQSVATADSKPVLTAALEWVQDAYNDNEEYQIDVATRLTEDQALRVMAVSESKRKRILEIFIQ